MFPWRPLCLMVVVLLFAPVTASANGTVTAVAPSPSPTPACELNVIKIGGSGSCTGVQLHLGDGTNTVNLPGVFPLLVYHAYSKPGTYALEAVGQGTCGGDVTASLQVVGPTLSSISGSVTPGGKVSLQGANFGEVPPGQIFIALSGQIARPLQITAWGPGIGEASFASGIIPANISGVPDQDAQIYLVTPCGNTSNSLTPHFTATRDLVRLPYIDINCSSTSGLGNSDACQSNGNYGVPPECGGIPTAGDVPPPTGFVGYHASGWGFSGESGNDDFFTASLWFTPYLINGWVFEGHSGISWWGSQAPSYWYVSPIGGGSPSVSVNWYANNCGAVEYYGDLYITGPRGVPYH